MKENELDNHSITSTSSSSTASTSFPLQQKEKENQNLIPLVPILLNSRPHQSSPTATHLVWNDDLRQRSRRRSMPPPSTNLTNFQIHSDQSVKAPEIHFTSSGLYCQCQRVLGLIYASFMAIVSTFVHLSIYFRSLFTFTIQPQIPSSSPSPTIRRQPNFPSHPIRQNRHLKNFNPDEGFQNFTKSDTETEISTLKVSLTAQRRLSAIKPFQVPSPINSTFKDNEPSTPTTVNTPRTSKGLFVRKKTMTGTKDQTLICNLCNSKSAKGPCRHIKMRELSILSPVNNMLHDDSDLLTPVYSSVPKRSVSSPPTVQITSEAQSNPSPSNHLLRDSIDIPPMILERSNEDEDSMVTTSPISPRMIERIIEFKEEKLSRCNSKKRKSIFSRSSTTSSVTTDASACSTQATSIETPLIITSSPKSSLDISTSSTSRPSFDVGKR